MDHNKIIHNDMHRLNLSAVIYGSYTKKEVLRDLVYNTYSNSSIETATNLKVFIDINSVIHALYSENNRIDFNNITDVSAGIINMCAHYRSFFRTLGVDTRFFLINSLNICDINQKFVANYNGEFLRKVSVCNTLNMINNNMSLLKVLCPYLPGIYYVDSEANYETAVIMAHIIEKINDGNPNLIISHDTYPLQLTALYPWTSYLYPSKYHSQDVSWMLPINEKYTYRDEFWTKIAARRNMNLDILKRISPINYSLFMACVAYKERNMPGVIAPIKAVKLIESIVGDADIKVLPNQILDNPEISNQYPVGIIDSRYKALDVQYILPFYNNSPEAKQLQFLDLDDAPTVNNIASKYYANNPLDLLKL